jgi:hypothetical protein
LVVQAGGGGRGSGEVLKPRPLWSGAMTEFQMEDKD